MSLHAETTTPTSILVVEDDASLCALLVRELGLDGYEVEGASDGRQGLARWRERGHDVLLLDLMLPSLDGVGVCGAVRADERPQPVILVLTARGTEDDAVLAFSAGADDFVRKPFGLQELRARIKAISQRLARAPRALGGGAGLRLELALQRASVGGAAVRLTPKEFELLAFFVGHAEQVHTREALLRAVWGYSHAGYARTVDSHVLRLRKKLAAAGLPSVPLETVHGNGYRWLTSD